MNLFVTIFFFFLIGFVDLTSQDTKLASPTAEQITETMIPLEVKSRINNFFDAIKRKEFKKAYEELLKNSPIVDKKEDLDNLLNQTERTVRIYGEFSGATYVNGHNASDNFIRLRYLGLYEKYPMRWIFTFYRSPKLGWIVTNIKLDDLSEFYLSE